MSKEIVINTDSQKTRIAIVENGSLAELFIETEEYERTIGNLFLGRIRRIMPSIQAAFVDIGQKQDAFLHYSDLADNLADWLKFVQEDNPRIGEFKPEHTRRQKGRRRRRPQHGRHRSQRAEEESEEKKQGEKGKHVPDARARGKRRSAQRRKNAGGDGGRDSGRRGDSGSRRNGGPPPSALLRRDQAILVKISKEPIAQKGSRITTDISLAGRFLVLVPMADYVAVSKKISSFKERRRLRALARMLVPDGFGVIVRTVAEGQNAKALDTDLRLLIDRWRKIEKRLAEHPKPPAVVHQDVNMVSSIIRDLFSDNYERILIDSQRLYRNIKSYVQAVAPDMVDSVRLHESDEPVFKTAGIDKKVAEAFERRVNMPSGGYLYFEQTEAMHVIDVNSGRAGKGMSQEDSSLKVNLEAARIIARQIRIRDLGGIIVVDFIDMRDERSRRKVFDELKKEFRRDRAVTKLLPMSDFGLIQITRQRLRPSITTTFSGPQASTQGNGEARREPEKQPEPRSESTQEVLPTPVRSSTAGATLTPDQLVEALDEWIRAYRAAGRRDAVRLQVHPFVAAFLNRRVPNQATRWFIRFRQRVRIEAVPTIDPLAYRFLDGETGNDLTFLPERERRGQKPDSGRSEGRAKEGGRASRSGSRDGGDAGRQTESDKSDGGSRGGRGRSRSSGQRRGDGSGGRRQGGSGGRRSSSRTDTKKQGSSGPESRQSGTSGSDDRKQEQGGGASSGGSRGGRRRGSRGGRGRSRGRSSGAGRDGGGKSGNGGDRSSGGGEGGRDDSSRSKGNRG